MFSLRCFFMQVCVTLLTIGMSRPILTAARGYPDQHGTERFHKQRHAAPVGFLLYAEACPAYGCRRSPRVRPIAVNRRGLDHFTRPRTTRESSAMTRDDRSSSSLFSVRSCCFMCYCFRKRRYLQALMMHDYASFDRVLQGVHRGRARYGIGRWVLVRRCQARPNGSDTTIDP